MKRTRQMYITGTVFCNILVTSILHHTVNIFSYVTSIKFGTYVVILYSKMTTADGKYTN